MESTLPDLGGTNPELNYQEAAGVQITAAWQAKSAEAMVPEPGPDGAVRFKYGQCMPQVVTGMFQQTDLEFEPGESFKIEDVHIGDPKRWVVEMSSSGQEGDSPIQHLFIQPLFVGIYTTLDVTTSRRTYRFFLVSHRDRFMHHVSFVYEGKPKAAEGTSRPGVTPVSAPGMPQSGDRSGAAPDPTPAPAASVQVAYVEVKPKTRRIRVHTQLEGKGEALEKVPHGGGYRIVGDAPWRPVQAYTENGHTYIEMPPGMGDHDAPVLYRLRKSGWFHTAKDIVPYRVHGHWYVADEVIDKGLLTVGAGGGAKSVTVIRTSGGNGL